MPPKRVEQIFARSLCLKTEPQLLISMAKKFDGNERKIWCLVVDALYAGMSLYMRYLRANRDLDSPFYS